MKRILTIIMTLALASCCSRKPEDPAGKAILQTIRQDTQTQYFIAQTMVLDSTTYATEITRRKGIYEIRIRQNTWRKEKYLKEKMPTNARRMDAFNKKDRLILSGLDSIAKSMGRDTNSIAYYDYAFKYYNKTPKGKKTEPKVAYAVLTPSFEVLTWSPSRRDLHKTTGLVIPGYEQILKELEGMEEDYHLK